MSLRAPSEPDLVPKFLVAAARLDALWNQFETEENFVSDCLITLDAFTKYSTNLPVEIADLVDSSKAVFHSLSPPISTCSTKTSKVKHRLL